MRRWPGSPHGGGVPLRRSRCGAAAAGAAAVSIPDITDIDARVGALIRAERIGAGLKQEDLAAAIGIDRTTLSRYEAGSRSIPIGVLIQIAYVLRAPLSALVPGARPMEQAWGAASAPLPPEVDSIARMIAQRPELTPRCWNSCPCSSSARHTRPRSRNTSAEAAPEVRRTLRVLDKDQDRRHWGQDSVKMSR